MYRRAGEAELHRQHVRRGLSQNVRGFLVGFLQCLGLPSRRRPIRIDHPTRDQRAPGALLCPPRLRTATDAPDFTRRLSTRGYLDKTAQRYCTEIRKIIEAAHGSAVGDDELWRFLRVIHVLSFDLNTSTSQTEAWIRTLLAHTAVGHDQLDVARATWRDLLALVGSGMPQAASFTWDALPSEIRQRHTPVGDADHTAITLLREHSAIVVNRISCDCRRQPPSYARGSWGPADGGPRRESRSGGHGTIGFRQVRRGQGGIRATRSGPHGIRIPRRGIRYGSPR